MEQGKRRGLSLPGLGQPRDLLEMGSDVTQAREQCSRVLAFSISMFTRALYSISGSSTVVPGAGGKRQGRMPGPCPLRPPAPHRVLTRQRVLRAQAQGTPAELGLALLQGHSSSPLGCWRPGGAGSAAPSPLPRPAQHWCCRPPTAAPAPVGDPQLTAFMSLLIPSLRLAS